MARIVKEETGRVKKGPNTDEEKWLVNLGGGGGKDFCIANKHHRGGRHKGGPRK